MDAGTQENEWRGEARFEFFSVANEKRRNVAELGVIDVSLAGR